MITMRKGQSKLCGYVTIAMLIFILSFIAIALPLAQAAVPRYINYQGKLTDAEDNPVTGDVSITIRIYDAATGGTALWTETQTTTVTRGIFSILLGNSEALDSLDFNSPYWYSVEVESDGEMTPRQRLTSVAYALNSDKLGGYESSEYLRVDASGGSTTGITVNGGLITAGANEDIELNPTGTGDIVITIDSTSGDFKITDGTTNFVLVDNATGNVTMSNDLTVSGTIYGTIASTGGSSTFSSLTVTGASDLRGNVSNSTGAVTVADALTQTGSTNQVTFAGNVDAGNGLDVTGDLTVSGAATLSGALDMNSNIDLDYSGSSAALDVTQSSTGPAAQFSGGRVVVGASEASNAYALSTGELYVLGDLEVDGTLYGNVSSSGTTSLGSTTLSSLTVTGASDLQGNISNSAGTVTVADYLSVTQTDSSTSGTVVNTAIQPTYQDGGTNSTTTAIGLNVAPTINYTGTTKTGSYTALKIAATETSLPTGTNYLIDAYTGSDGTTQKFYVDNSGNASFAGTVLVATPTAAGHAVTKAYADDITPATAGGWTDGGTGVYLLTDTDKVGVGTSATDTYKLNISGSTNTTSFYINGTQVNATAANLNELISGGSTTLHTHDASGINGTAIVANPTSDQTITAQSATVTPLALKGAASQSDNLLEFSDSSSNLLTYVDPSGRMLFDLGSGDYGLAIAESLTAGAQDSAAKIYFGRNATDDWETFEYDPTLGSKGKFTFSAPLQVEASSPTGITFVQKENGVITKSQGLTYDPGADEFSFTGGKLKQTFANLIRNGSFESYRPTGWDNVNTTWGTDMSIVTDSAVAKFGSKYLKILDNTSSYAKGLKCRVDMPERFFGDSLTISIWARCVSGTATASVGYSYSSSDTNATTAKNISLTTTWQNFKWTFPDAVPSDTTTVIYIYLYGAGVNNPDANGVGTITATATNTDYVYFDGITLAQGNLAVDYEPMPLRDTGNQVLYGNLAIGANSDPTGGGQPTLVFGEPDSSFYYSGYSGWSMESGQISYEQLGGYASGRFMFNKPIRVYPGYSTGWGAGIYLGEGGTVDFANNRTDAYIQGKVESDGGFYGDGSNITGITGAVQLNPNGAIVNSSGLKVNLETTNPSLAITDNKLALASNYVNGAAYDSRFINAAGGDTITGTLNFAGGTTYYVNGSGTASLASLNLNSGGIINAGAISGATSITASSNITVNTNKFIIDGASGNATMAGILTQLSSVGLIPEYDNAIVRPDGADNFGTMMVQSDTTDATLANRRSYYEWTTSEPTTQDCDIVVKYRLPEGFSSFDSTPIKLWNKVSAAPGSTAVTVTMLDTLGAPVTLTGGSTLQNTFWTETTITLDATGKTFSQGEYITLIIKLSADQGKVADVGELTLKGNW